MHELDTIDRQLLKLVQEDASLTAADLSARLNLSASQIGRRRLRLEADGIITGTHARISAQKTGMTVQAFIQVQMAAHTPESHASFLRLTQTQAQITAAWTLTGEADYLLRIYCADLSDLNRVVQDVLLPHPAVARVQSQIVMDQIKLDAPLPV